MLIRFWSPHQRWNCYRCLWKSSNFKYWHLNLELNISSMTGKSIGEQKLGCDMVYICIAAYMFITQPQWPFIVFTYKKLTLDLITETTALFQSSCQDHLKVFFSTGYLQYFLVLAENKQFPPWNQPTAWHRSLKQIIMSFQATCNFKNKFSCNLF